MSEDWGHEDCSVCEEARRSEVEELRNRVHWLESVVKAGLRNANLDNAPLSVVKALRCAFPSAEIEAIETTDQFGSSQRPLAKDEGR